MLQYSLFENQLTERPDDYAALPISSKSYDLNALIQRVLEKGTLLTKTDLLAAYNGIEEAITAILKEGSNINLPLINTSFSISGVFEGPMDSFDPNRHKLNINVSKGVVLRDIQTEVKLEKIPTITPQPQIVEIKDFVTEKTNETLTPGGVLQLWGYNIKIAGENPNCGLWFEPTSDGEPVKATVIVQNKPASIIATVPLLTAGTYNVKVITQYSGSKNLKEPKISTFAKTLNVQ